MKVIHISFSDLSGGAAVAAYRIHKAQLSIGIDSEFWVEKAISGDFTVKNKGSAVLNFGKLVFPKVIFKLFRTENKILHSLALFPSFLIKKINESNADFVNLHWIQNEMLSIEDIKKIKKPIIWTLHDMWAFCGAEHYTDDLRWQEGYFNQNRPNYEKGLDLNKWVWKRKLRNWKKPFTIVTPSI